MSDIRACWGHCQEMAAKNKYMKQYRSHFLLELLSRHQSMLKEACVSLQDWQFQPIWGRRTPVPPTSWIISYPKCTLSELKIYNVASPFSCLSNKLWSYCRNVPVCNSSSVCFSVYILGIQGAPKRVVLWHDGNGFPTLHVSFEQEHNAWASHNFRGQTKASICPSAWHMLSQLITVSIKI